jgi:hypothetical protein
MALYIGSDIQSLQVKQALKFVDVGLRKRKEFARNTIEGTTITFVSMVAQFCALKNQQYVG